MNRIVGAKDILFVVLDTLRYDVARDLARAGRTPNLAAVLPGGEWEERDAPGTFTYASHHAMFAGFLPTPSRPGRHRRLFALRFEGSETTGSTTCVLDGPNIVAGLRDRGYRTICIGGVGFFNKQNALGRVLPDLFDESHWSDATSVRDPDSTKNQVALAVSLLDETPREQRVFLFVNVSALHQPNHFYLPGSTADTIESHAAALEYVDSQLPPLFDALRARGGAFAILCSDHGSAYGEDGYRGHRIAHPTVLRVPYAETILEGT
jgi:predicted AlkP superfamily pyrophosphatase or phosphodiesterase